MAKGVFVDGVRLKIWRRGEHAGSSKGPKVIPHGSSEAEEGNSGVGEGLVTEADAKVQAMADCGLEDGRAQLPGLPAASRS